MKQIIELELKFGSKFQEKYAMQLLQVLLSCFENEVSKHHKGNFVSIEWHPLPSFLNSGEESQDA